MVFLIDEARSKESANQKSRRSEYVSIEVALLDLEALNGRSCSGKSEVLPSNHRSAHTSLDIFFNIGEQDNNSSLILTIPLLETKATI
jgi:hypothetical protein